MSTEKNYYKKPILCGDGQILWAFLFCDRESFLFMNIIFCLSLADLDVDLKFLFWKSIMSVSLSAFCSGRWRLTNIWLTSRLRKCVLSGYFDFLLHSGGFCPTVLSLNRTFYVVWFAVAIDSLVKLHIIIQLIPPFLSNSTR